MTRILRAVAVMSLMLGAAGTLAGCKSEEEKEATELTQEALDIDSTDEVVTAKGTKDVLVKKQTEVIDAESGAVLGEKTETERVEVTTKVSKDVDIEVSDPQVSESGDTSILDQAENP